MTLDLSLPRPPFNRCTETTGTHALLLTAASYNLPACSVGSAVQNVAVFVSGGGHLDIAGLSFQAELANNFRALHGL
jgi:hypothetical protein